MHDAINVDPVKARLGCRRVEPNKSEHSHHQQQHEYNMIESHHPDERPSKKRRFFTENSSPAKAKPKRKTSRQPTPPPAAEHVAPTHDEAIENGDAAEMDGFDVGMLQAVVGELSQPTLQKLKDVSGNNVERGPYTHGTRGSGMLTRSSN